MNEQVLLTRLVIIHANITYYRYKSVIIETFIHKQTGSRIEKND